MSNETYGLLLRKANRYGTDYVVAEVIVRNEEGKIRNASDSITYDRIKPLNTYALEGLQMDGFVSEFGDPRYIGFEPRYRDRYSVELRDAMRMAKTLGKIYAHVKKAFAQEPGDWFMSLCKVLKISFVVESKNPHYTSSYDDNKWRWMSVGEGRNRYRELINEVVDAAKAAKQEVAV